MPKQIIDDNIWRDQIPDADKYYEEWEHLFRCDILEKYYEGQQWAAQGLGYNPYVINKVYETVQIKIAEFVPTMPYFMVTPKPSSSSYDIGAAIQATQLKQDILNQTVDDMRRHFGEELEAAYKDSLFRFGIMEVGYSADWILNPNAVPPLKKGDVDKYTNDKHRIVSEPEELPLNERVYIKHIPAKRFRVGGLDHKYLNNCGWVGYWDWINEADLLAMKGLMNKDKIESSMFYENHIETARRDPDKKHEDGAKKYWNIWHKGAQVHLLILDDNYVTFYQRRYKRLPLFDLRPDKRLRTDGYYPIPPVFHWISPQDEINETREMIRAHRRRFIRKFQIMEGKVDDEEIQKFEDGPDGAAIKVKEKDAISPIQNADLGTALQEALVTSSDDLNRISGTSDPARGVSERGTATEANIVNAMSSVRQKKDMEKISWWLSAIGREILMTTKDNFAMGFWVYMTSPEGTDEVQEEQGAFQWVSSEQLEDGYDFRITVDVTSISVTAQQDEEQKFMKFLAMMQQYGPMLMFDPVLIQEAAYRVGYRNLKVIRAFQKQALLMELGRIQGMQPQMGNAGNQMAQQMTPPGGQQIQNQMAGQKVLG